MRAQYASLLVASFPVRHPAGTVGEMPAARSPTVDAGLLILMTPGRFFFTTNKSIINSKKL
jgi:hypothetical protein